MSIRYRLFFTIILVMSLGFYILTGWVLDELKPRYLESVEDALVDTSQTLATLIESQMQSPEIPVEAFRSYFEKLSQRQLKAPIYQLYKTNVDFRFYLINLEGKVIYDSYQGQREGEDYSQWRDFILTKQGLYGSRSTKDPLNPTASILHVAAPILYQGQLAGVLVLAKPTGNIRFFLNLAQPRFRLVALLIAMGVIVLTITISTWITIPLKRLLTYVRQIKEGKKVSYPQLGKTEINELGQAIEEMRESLELKNDLENTLQTFAHELKSPLAAVFASAELLKEDLPQAQRQKFLENILRENERMQIFIQKMLNLVQVEKQKEIKQAELIDVNELLENLKLKFESRLLKAALSLDLQCEANLLVHGDAFLIEQALSNILENAISFSPLNSKIVFRSYLKDKQVIISCRDYGPGIPAYALEKVSQKYFSLPHPSSGRRSTGLGLAFVKEVMNLHAGAFILNNCPEGGLELILSFVVGME